MAFWDFLRRRQPAVGVVTPNVQVYGIPGLAGFDITRVADVASLTPAQMWDGQPHLRTVVTFLARNIAQLGLHSFERVSQLDRRRDRGSAFAKSIRNPDLNMTGYDLIYATVIDQSVYDRAYWFINQDGELPGGWMFRRIPPSWVTETGGGPFETRRYVVSWGDGEMSLPVEKVLKFPGYSPTDPTGSSSPINALRNILQEQVLGAKYRYQVWQRGGRVSAVLQRPADAPEWSEDQATRFRDDWNELYTGNGPRSGGTPILEDGMTLNRVDFSPEQMQFVEATKLSFSTVASVYHVNPTMVGLLDQANYANVREFRKMLYGDTLGPIIKQIEDRINTFLLPMLGMDSDRMYVEFNVEAKLRGNFEDQALAMQSAVGRPWMVADEARALMNMPQIGGEAARVVTPLNVIAGGQASPRDSGSQNRNGRAVLVKARPDDPDVIAHREMFEKFFARQGRAVQSALGVKADAWWDGDRWDRELAADLLKLQVSASARAARLALSRAGLDPESYDTERTRKYLAITSERISRQVNATTKSQVESVLVSGDVRQGVKDLFEIAVTSRAAQSAMTATTTAHGFGLEESGKQRGGRATKTWTVTSGNPRPEHAVMDGQTVPVGDTFTNGARWPGDPILGADGNSNCSCELTINYGS